MTYQDLHETLKSKTSRAVVLSGFGCVELWVPYRSVKELTSFCEEYMLAGIHWEVHSLQEGKIFLKKGKYEFCGGNLLATMSLGEMINKYFKKGIK